MWDEVDKFLDEARGEGELESEGSFSINLDNARRKVVQYGLDSPDKGLLKFIQLAIACRAREVEIHIKEESLSITVHGATGKHMGLATPSEPLQVAIWSCLHSGFKSASISEPGRTWRFEDEIIHKEDPITCKPETTHIEFQRAAPGGFWDRMRSLMKGRTQDTAVLGRRLKYAAIPITLDRRSLNQHHYSARTKTHIDIFLTGGQKTLPHEINTDNPKDWKAKHILFNNRNMMKAEHGFQSFGACYRQGLPSRFGFSSSAWGSMRKGSHLAHLWAPPNLKKPKLVFVRYGVIVGSVDFHVPGIVSAAGVDVDLSGLELVHNSKLEKFVAYMQTVLGRESAKLAKLKPPRAAAVRLKVLAGLR